ncbi:MAG: hypothetical protein BRD33_05035 [Bacteroidetes bacterium QH_6_63_17]|nr:MAG: hypothetical protein BRD33_05035 [Bacteroidetes bacterium QH_6_63_17]
MSTWPPPLGTPSYLTYLLVFGAAAFACLVSAGRARRISNRGVRRSLVGLLLISAAWAAAHVGMLLSGPLWLKAGFYEVGLVIGFGTVWAWLWFCSAFSGRTLHRHRGSRALAGTLFALVALMKLTNAWHGLYFSTGTVAEPFFHLTIDYNILYWGTAALSYMGAAVGFFMLYESLRRVQVGAGTLAGLFGLTALPIFANAVGYTRPWLLDLSHEPVGVAAFAVGTLYVSIDRFAEAQEAGRQAQPVLMISETGRLRNYNEQAAALFSALETPEALGSPLSAVLPDVADVLAGDSDLLTLGEGTGARYYRPAESPFRPGPGRAIVLEDVTERHLRRQQVDREHRILLRAVEEANQAIVVTEAEPLDEPGPQIEYVNEAFEEMTGYSEKEVLGETPCILQGPETKQEVLDAMRGTLEAGEAWKGETVNYRKDGTPYRMEEGEIEHWVSIQRDVTEREKNRRKLERYHRYTDHLLDAIDDLFFVLDEEGQFRRWNDSVPEVTGYSEEEIGSMSAFDLVPEDEHERFAEQIEEVLTSGHAQVEVPLLREDGMAVPYEFAGNLVEHPDESRQMVGIGRDVTDQERRKRQLERQNDLFERAQEIADVGAWEYDAKADEGTWTKKAYTILGYPLDADPHPRNAVDFYHPEDQPRVRDALQRAIEEGESSG